MIEVLWIFNEREVFPLLDRGLFMVDKSAVRRAFLLGGEYMNFVLCVPLTYVSRNKCTFFQANALSV